MYFDARAAKLLPVGEHLIVDGCAGLRLVAAPRWKSWVYRYKDAAGRMRQTAIGRWPAMPVAEAVSRWQALREGRAAGLDPVAVKRQAKATARAELLHGLTVRDVVEAYARDVLPGSRSPASLKAATSALDRLLSADLELAAAAPKAITRARAFDVLAGRADAPTATAKLRSLLGAAWDHALDAGRMEPDTPNWWREVLRGKLRSRGKIVGGAHLGQSHAVLTLAECGQVLRWGAEHMHGHGFDVLVLYLWTGARGVEILRLAPAHFSLAGGVLWATLPKALTKNAAVPRAVDLRIPMLGRARWVVQRRLDAAAAGAVMWPDAAGGAYTQKAFSTAVYDLMPGSTKGARRGTGWPVVGWSAHRLRATVRTLLAGLGCPHDVGEAIMGHLPPVTAGTYNRYQFDAERVLWLGRLADQLESAWALPLRP
jgi:integrase